MEEPVHTCIKPEKRIVVCCDGTSNTAYESPTDNPPTNVFRISNYIKPFTTNQIRQIILYQPGIGTESGVGLITKLTRGWKQAWGVGIEVNILAAYHFICLNYQAGDKIILIGFSRGALTVRCLIKLIHELGLLSPRGLANLHQVFETWWSKPWPNDSDMTLTNAREKVGRPRDADWHPGRPSIEACGLWDTVDSVGRKGVLGRSSLGIKRDGIPSRVTDGPIKGVKHVFHALSLHERRSLFQPEISGVSHEEGEDSELQQCWFSGYHGDVGGGRPGDVLAHLSLTWMIARLYKYVELDWSVFYEDEMCPLNDRIRPHGKDKDSEVSQFRVSDTMSSFWRLGRTFCRQPGTNNEISVGEESIHWSVSLFTSGVTRQSEEEREQEGQARAEIEFLIDPCWFFNKATYIKAKPRRWKYRDTNPANRDILEAEKKIEMIPIQKWASERLIALQNEATLEGGGEPGTHYMVLFQEVFTTLGT